MLSQVERVNAAWVRIENWYAANLPDTQLGAPTTAAEITATETRMGLTFPEELKASLMRHNGTENWTRETLLHLEHIEGEWMNWAESADDGELDGVGEDNDFIQKCYFHKSWIPIDVDGGSNATCLDLSPGPKGVVGQIIRMDNIGGGENIPLFPDLAAYLEHQADMLEGGKYEIEDGFLMETDGSPENIDENEDGEEEMDEEEEENEDRD